MTTQALGSAMPSSSTMAVKGAEGAPAGMMMLAGTTRWLVALLASEIVTGRARLPLRETRPDRLGEDVFSSTFVSGTMRERANGITVRLVGKVVLLVVLDSTISPRLLTVTKKVTAPAEVSPGSSTTWVRVRKLAALSELV